MYKQSDISLIRTDCEVSSSTAPAPLSDAAMEQAAMETNFWTELGIELGTLCTRVKDLNHCATLLLNINTNTGQNIIEKHRGEFEQNDPEKAENEYKYRNLDQEKT